MSEQKRETIDLRVLPDNPPFGFRVRWRVLDHWADVEVFEIVGVEVSKDAHIRHFLFHPKEDDKSDTRTPGYDFVESIDQAEPYLTGFIKWDGCTELDQGNPHWCGVHDFRQHCVLLKYLWTRAFELMGREAPDRWEG